MDDGRREFARAGVAPVRKCLAAVLGRSNIGALASGMCADFFSISLNTVDMDPVIGEGDSFSCYLAGLQPTWSS